jgi:hypothetical protein
VSLLDEMVEHGILPTRRSYDLVAEACQRAGEARVADEVQSRWVADRERLARAHQARSRPRRQATSKATRQGLGFMYPYQTNR